MRKIFLTLLMLIIPCVIASADVEVITEFSDRSIPILNEQLRKLNKDIENLPADTDTDTNDKAKVSASDTTTGYLYDKLIAGSNVTITKNNAASNETMTFSVAVPTTGSIGVTFDNGTSKVALNTKAWVYMPYACTITGWTMLVDNIVDLGPNFIVDVWKDTYANYPPTVADKISATNSPYVTGANKKNQSTNLAAWTTTAVSSDDVIMFNVSSINTQALGVKKAVVVLNTTR